MCQERVPAARIKAGEKLHGAIRLEEVKLKRIGNLDERHSLSTQNEIEMRWTRALSNSAFPSYSRGYGGSAKSIIGALEKASDELLELGPHNVAVIGTISAGGLVEGWGDNLGSWPVSWELLRRSPNAKALRVSGNSLASEGIYDGDIVIMDPDQKEVVDGRLYAVRSEEYNQTTAARRIYTVGRRRLKLVSGDGDVVEVERSQTTIEGRIIRSFRETEH